MPGEDLVASLTAGERTNWANIRQTLFSKGANKTALFNIESAAFVLSLDDRAYECDIKKPDTLDNFGRMLLHGNGHDRWFDKSFTVVVGTNGKVGFNAEHTWLVAFPFFFFVLFIFHYVFVTVIVQLTQLFFH